jgi:hypothetical protein
MADSEVKLIIGGDASGAIAAQEKYNAGLKKMSADTGGIMGQIKSHWLGLTAGIAAAMVTIQQAWDLADMASQFEEQMGSLNSLAAQYNTSASSIVADIQRVSKGMIAQTDAVDIAAKGLMKGMDPTQMTNLAGAAETLSNVSGRKVVDIFGEISEALETGKMKALKMQLGIIDLDAVYGNAASTMSDTEKAQAMYNIVMEKTTALSKTLGDQTLSANDKMEQFTTTLKDGQLALGQLLLRGAALVVSWGQAWTAGTLLAIAGISKVAQGLGWLLEKIPLLSKAGKAMKDWGAASSSAAWDTMKEQWAKSKDSMSLAWNGPDIKSPAKSTGPTAPTENLKAMQDALKKSLTDNLGSYTKYYTDLKKLQGDYKTAIEKSLKEIADIDKKILEARRNTQQALMTVNEKANPAANEMEDYTRKQARLEQDLSYAMSQSGEDRIKGLQDYQKAWTEMVKQIDYTDIERKLVQGDTGSYDFQNVETKKTWLSLGDSANTASQRIQQAGALIEQTQQDMRTAAETQLNAQITAFNSLSSAIDLADQWVKYLKQTITDLDKGLLNPRTLTIDCSGALAQLQDVMNKMSQIASMTGVSLGNQVAPATSQSTSPVIDSFASGTNYVPRTGLYQLHKGEAVTPAAQNSGGSPRPVTISMGNIVINGVNKDAHQLAREILPALQIELRKLESRK